MPAATGSSRAAWHRVSRARASSFTRPGIEVIGDEYVQWPVTALLFLDARDLDEATTIAASHPAKDYNVAMEVRPRSTPIPNLQPLIPADSL